LLIFGVGRDTSYWVDVNKEGRTAFLEDNEKWFEKIKKANSGLEVYFVNYDTKRRHWKKLLSDEKELIMDLPETITKTEWDIVLVDGPQGFHRNTPGRMKSIYMSKVLAKNGGDIFVHDCDRKIERVYCDKYLVKENLVNKVVGGIGLITTIMRITLRHYKKN
jgi:glucuronoxylan 4-O-methyltransferase